MAEGVNTMAKVLANAHNIFCRIPPYRLFFVVFPNLPSAGARWGLLQSLLSIVFFLFGIPAMLIFLQPDGGGIMSTVIIVFFALGFLALVYTGWLGKKFYDASKNQVDTTAKKEDINHLEQMLVSHFNANTKVLNRVSKLLDKIYKRMG